MSAVRDAIDLAHVERVARNERASKGYRLAARGIATCGSILAGDDTIVAWRIDRNGLYEEHVYPPCPRWDGKPV